MQSENDILETENRSLECALYLLPVPMSDNCPDTVIPAYNIDIIRGISHFVVENIRTARRFLKKFDRSININLLTFTELSEHTSESELPDMLSPISEGKPVGIMSEAGCPAVADPGARLVALAQQRGIKVVPLVGPSSILLSLMASGFNGQNFTFDGYLPIEEKAREAALRNMSVSVTRHNVTHIFIETPYRNNSLMATLLKVLPRDMKLCVASDITGPAESILTRTVGAWQQSKTTLPKIPTIFLIGQ